MIITDIESVRLSVCLSVCYTVQCQYNSDWCGVDAFEHIPTNLGFCFSFNPGRYRLKATYVSTVSPEFMQAFMRVRVIGLAAWRSG